MMRGGSIVDASFVESPSSTKTAIRSRDPETHQARKGNAWHFGYKALAGMDLGIGLAHAVEVTAANAPDVVVAPRLPRPGDQVCYADARHPGAEGLVERRRSKVPGRDHPDVLWGRGLERSLARVRARVELPSTW